MTAPEADAFLHFTYALACVAPSVMADLEAGLNVCRICLSDEDPESLIAPCLCAGTPQSGCTASA